MKIKQIMHFLPLNFKILFYSIDNLRNTIVLSILMAFSWAFFSGILKIYNIVYYDFFNLRILFSNLIFSFFIIIFFRSVVLSSLVFLLFMILPFLTYFFLKKGFLYTDIYNVNELAYVLGNLITTITVCMFIIFISITIVTNIRNFKIRIFIFQIILLILFFFSYKQPENYLKILYPSKPNIDAFNISASFRFIGPVDGFFYNYLDNLAFNKEIQKNESVFEYDDFRSFDINKFQKLKNVHLIILESFLDPLDFKNIEIKKDEIPNQWIDYKNTNSFRAISPVVGGGSAQAEFEVLCGVPSILEYGTEFNRIGLNETFCLPSYLKKHGYKTLASQPIYGSFFNTETAYKSIGFNESYLANKLDMTEKENGWLKNESFFNQHFQIIKPFLMDDIPLFNYLFAVGCHSTLGKKNQQEKILVYPNSEVLENFLNCNANTLKHLIKYINKIQELDSESLIIILPDHNPPGVGKSFKDAGYFCNTKTDTYCNRTVNGIFIGSNEFKNQKNKYLGYYEIPELIINEISNNLLCKTIYCKIKNDQIIVGNKVVNRSSLKKITDQSLLKVQKKTYISLIKETLVN